MARPKTHANQAARQAAYRERTKAVQVTIDQIASLDTIAAELDCSRNELVHSMIHFALMNRNWKYTGLFGPRSWSKPSLIAARLDGEADQAD